MHLLLSAPDGCVAAAVRFAGFLTVYDADVAVSAVGAAAAAAVMARSNVDSILLQAASVGAGTIRTLLERTLPEDAHVRCSAARVEVVSATASLVAWGGLVRTRKWTSRPELIDCVVAATTKYRPMMSHRRYGCSAVGCPLTEAFGGREPILLPADPTAPAAVNQSTDALLLLNSGSMYGIDFKTITDQRLANRTPRRAARRPKSRRTRLPP